MQLVAYGAQDVYLTGNPEITFFKVVYRRHTNFSVETIEHPINSAQPGAKNNIEILRNGDLATKMAVKIDLPPVTGDRLTYNDDPVKNTKIAYVRRLGHVLLKDVELQIGGSQIDKHYNTWLDIFYELTHREDQKRGYAQLIGDVDELTTLRGRTSSTNTAEVVLPRKTLHIPLQFWFNRNVGLALPLIALQYHQVRVLITFEEVSKLFVYSGEVVPNLSGFQFEKASVMVDYVYLDSEERRRFAQVGHEYLIEQLQFTSEQNLTQTQNGAPMSQQFRLDFNHPCKELVWATKLGAFNGDRNRGRFLCYTNKDDEERHWDDQLAYAARNLANGELYFGPQPTSFGQWEQVEFTGEVAAETQGVLQYTDGNGTLWDFIVDNRDATNSVGLDGTPTLQPIWININALRKDGTNLGLNLQYVSVNLVVNAANASEVITSALFNGNVVASTVPSLFPSDALTVIDHSMDLNDVSIPVEDFFDSRSHRAVNGSNAKSPWDVLVIQPHNYGLRLDRRGNPIVDGNIKLNGSDRFDVQDGDYFNYLQTMCHTHTPADGINVYSFALHPEQHQPSGSANLSRIDNTTLHLRFGDRLRVNRVLKLDYTKDSKFFVYAVNYNVLRVLSGMGGLGYSS